MIEPLTITFGYDEPVLPVGLGEFTVNEVISSGESLIACFMG
jgi:hypothetical protein